MRLRNTFLVLAALVGPAATCLQGQDLQARFEKSLSDARSISNIVMRVVDTYWERDPVWLKQDGAIKRDFSRTFEYSYIRMGKRYRATCKLLSGTETNLAKEFESVFDGTSYICYDADQRYMTKSRTFPDGERGESHNSPLTAPFMFLSPQSDDCLPCKLRFADIVVADFAKGLVLPKGQESNGLIRISMTGPPLGKLPTLWSIAADEAGDSFTPRSITRTVPGFGQEAVYELLSYTNLGRYQFPTTIAWTASVYGGAPSPSLLSTGMITVVWVQVPEKVGDSTFQLDEESAVTIWDSDQKNFTKSGPASETCPAYLKLHGPREHQPSTNTQPATTDRLSPPP